MTTVREPKQDRSRATRQRLLESTIVCLAEMGWGATTVAVVAEHSGVSRGAAQHHFPTREDLITAALEHMFDSRMQQAVAAAASAPAVQKTEAVLTGLMEYFTGPLFKAAVQVGPPQLRTRSSRSESSRSKRSSAGSPIARQFRRSGSTTPTGRPTTSSKRPSTSHEALVWPTS